MKIDTSRFWKSALMLRNFCLILCFFLFILFSPLVVSSAEVLQVRSSSLLQIGDRNRSYTVKLACSEVDPSDEIAATNLIKSTIKRGKRVNLKPIGSVDGILLAKVNLIGSNIDLSEALFQEKLAQLVC